MQAGIISFTHFASNIEFLPEPASCVYAFVKNGRKKYHSDKWG